MSKDKLSQAELLELLKSWYLHYLHWNPNYQTSQQQAYAQLKELIEKSPVVQTDNMDKPDTEGGVDKELVDREFKKFFGDPNLAYPISWNDCKAFAKQLLSRQGETQPQKVSREETVELMDDIYEEGIDWDIGSASRSRGAKPLITWLKERGLEVVDE